MKDSITNEMIKELRAKTGVSISKCKNALVRAEGSIEKAIEILRKEGITAGISKAYKTANEGLIGCSEKDNFISIVEINTETDFVAQNEKFKAFLIDIAEQITKKLPSSLEELLSQKFIVDESMTVDEYKNILIQQFGENIQIKRMKLIEKIKNASYGIYIHMGGKIVSIVEIEGAEDQTVLAKDIAMHVAAESPRYLQPEEIEKDVLEKEKEIAFSQVKDKPPHIKDKIVEGKIKAFYDEVCLLRQKFIKDPSVTIKEVIEKISKDINKAILIKRFWCWKIGE
ncbi:MAG: elongation factor Ts [Chlamydiae bacterium SM23_39]|nr:MAG: elongation factor Ts [Chlamydiae bacterium SM23_39]